MLELTGITLKSGRKTWLKDVSLTARPRRLTGIVGQRGSGKTELVRVIMGLITPDEGTVELEGHELGFGDRQNFGYLPAERGGYPGMKVLEQIVYLARLHGMTMGAAERNAVTLLSRLDLSDRAYAPLSHLSGTEVARAEIAAVLAADPDVVVLDDPFDGLDAASTEKVFSLLRDHADSGVPVIFTSDSYELTESVADDVIALDRGKVAGKGALATLRRDANLYAVRYESAAAAEAGRTSLVAHPGIDVADDEETGAADRELVVFSASDPQAAFAAVAATSGVTEYGAHNASLAELLKERI